VLLSMLPVGIIQAQASLDRGLWYARSAELMQTPLMMVLKWLRVPGDIIFAVGALTLAWFVIGLRGGWSLQAPAVRRQNKVEIPRGEAVPS